MAREVCWFAHVMTHEITFAFRFGEFHGELAAWVTIAQDFPIGPLAISSEVREELHVLLGRMVHLVLGLVTLETQVTFRFQGGPHPDDVTAWVTLAACKEVGPFALAKATADELGRLLARAMSLLLDAEELPRAPLASD